MHLSQRLTAFHFRLPNLMPLRHQRLKHKIRPSRRFKTSHPLATEELVFGGVEMVFWGEEGDHEGGLDEFYYE